MKKKPLITLLTLLMSMPIASCSFGPQPGGLTVKEAANMIASSGQKYGFGDASSALAKARTLLSTFATSDTEMATEGDVLALIKAEFGDLTEEKVGARVFEAYLGEYDSSVEEEHNLLQFVSGELGIYSPSFGYRYLGSRAVKKDYVETLIARLHAYIGRSEKDDFFSTVNHDFLYDNCPDEGTNEDSIYRSNLIPTSRINAWANERGKVDKDFADFESTYLDKESKAPGNIGGLVAALEPILSASTMSEFLAANVSFFQAYGYCPLWGETSLAWLSPAGKKSLVYTIEPYSYEYDPSYIKGSGSYLYSINRFTKVFNDMLNCGEAKAKEYATDYSDFKYEMGQVLRRSSYDPDSHFSIEKDQKYGDFAFDLYDFMRQCGFEEPGDLAFSNAKCTHAVLSLFAEKNLPLFKGLAIWSAADHYSGALNEQAMTDWMGYDFEKESTLQSLYYRDLTSFAQYGLAENYLHDEAGLANIAAAETLLGQLKEAMTNRLSSSFLSSDSQIAAKEKATAMYASIAGKGTQGVTSYFTTDFKSISEGGTYFTNRSLFDKDKTQYLLAKTGVFPDERANRFVFQILDAGPLYANAFYMPSCNGLVITLGYVAAYPAITEMSEEEKLATYGWVVGHELSHGYDRTGIFYNREGQRVSESIFTKEDKQEYTVRLNKVANFYNGYEVMPGQATSGKNTVDEATADLTGLSLSLDIASKINGFDYASFFRKGAESFGSYASQAYYQINYSDDEHPFGKARVNRAFSSLDKFHETFGTKEGDGMYVAKADRPVIY